MDKKSILKQLTRAITLSVELKRRLTKNIFSKEIAREVHDKERQGTEDLITEIITGVFEEQIGGMVSRLREMDETEEKSFEDDAEALTSLITTPEEWKEEIVNAMLPILAEKMAEAGIAQWMQWGVDPRKLGRTL